MMDNNTPTEQVSPHWEQTTLLVEYNDYTRQYGNLPLIAAVKLGYLTEEEAIRVETGKTIQDEIVRQAREP